VPVVAGGMERSKNDNRIFPNDEEDTIRKASDKNPPDVRMTTQSQVAGRIFHRAPGGRANLKGEFQTQARVAILMPERGGRAGCPALRQARCLPLRA